jgi:NitT/TauT family transport system substrate-binding protein
MKRKMIVIAIVISLLTASVGCGTASSTNTTTTDASGQTQELVTVRLANLNAGSIPQQLGDEKGIFAKYGIKLQVVQFSGGAQAAAGTASGEVDMGSYGTPILTAISKKIPIKIVAAPPIKGQTFILVAANDIKTVADLRGKTVASGSLGGGSHQALLKILAGNGLSDQDCTVITSGNNDAAVLLASGQVSAVISSAPTDKRVESMGIGHLLAEAKDYYGKYQHSYIYATDDFIAKHPETIVNFLLAQRETLEYAASHFEELIALALTQSELDESILRADYERQIKEWDLSFEVDLEAAYNAVEAIKSLDEIDADIFFDADTWVDPRFLEEANKDYTPAGK